MKKDIKKYFGSDEAVAIVYPCGYPVGFGVAKALTGNGVKVIALDNNPHSVAKYSRKFLHKYEPSIKSSEDLVLFLEGFLKKFSVKPVLFLVDDEDVIEVKKKYDVLSEYAHLTVGNRGREDLVDKTTQYEKFIAEGIDAPRVLFLSKGASIDEAEKTIGYPCLVKPDLSLGLKQKTGKKLLICDNRQELEKAIGIVESVSDGYVLQEYIPGGCDKLYTFGSYVARDGKRIVSFTGRKLRQFPPDFGTCRCGESVREEELEDVGKEVIQKLGYKGISQLEFKYDERDGKYKVIEINARSWLWISLAVSCGVNLPYAAYCDFTGKEVPEYEQIKERIIWVNMAEDMFNSIHGYKACGYEEYSLSFLDWVRTVSGRKTYAFFSWDDPIPALVRTWQFLRSYPGLIEKEKQHNAGL